MDRSVVLNFHKCFFCSKNYNKLQLTDITQNTVMINDEEIGFTDLILDVCLVQIDNTKSSYICTECNNNLLSFHFFKRDVKKYSDFSLNIEKLKIIAKIEEFLNAAESLEDLHILQDTSSITISSKIDVLDDEKIKHEIISTNLMHSLKQKNLEGPEIIKEVHQENLEFSSSAAECFEMIEEESPEVDDDNFDDEATESDPESHEDFLTSEQLNWIRDELETSQIKHGRKTMFRCSVCFKLVSSSDYLSTHLKEIHIVEESEVEKSMGFKQCENFLAEIASSRFLLLTKSGQEHFWKCRRCKKTFKSEHSFRFHLRSKHLNEFSKAEVEFAVEIAEPSDKFYLEEVMVEEHLEDEGPVPKKRKLNTLEDLTEEQIAWLRKNVAAGEMIEDNVKIFKCVICNQVLSTQASLIRHVRDVHVMKNSERDEKNIVKGEVGSSRLEIKTSLGVETIWKCKRCESERIYKSEQSFKIHLRMKHLRVTKVETAFVAACKTQIFEGKVTKEVWRCPDCARIFRHRDSLRNHIKLEHPNMDEEAARKKMLDEPPIDVEENGKAMTRIIQKLEHKTVGKSLSFCHECGIKFETSKHHNKPKVHQDCHDSFKILAPHFPRFRCDDCRVIFNSEESLAHHTNLHGSSDIVHLIPAEGLATFGSKYYKDPIGDADDAVDEAVCWKCAHCPVRYFDENDCLNHILMMHSTSIFCCIDNREFFGSGGLGKFNQHMKNKHPELFPDLKYPCSGCQEEFSSVYEKLAHQKNCKSKKFGCDYCGKRFFTKHQLQSHILYELNLAGFSCEVCGKRCKTLSDLKIHQNIHTQSRPYHCSICPKTFKTPGARSTHMEGHNCEKLECEHCGQKLANRTLYKRHMQFQHNQEFRDSQLEKNVCEICQKSFVRTPHFKSHMKQQHGIES